MGSNQNPQAQFRAIYASWRRSEKNFPRENSYSASDNPKKYVPNLSFP